MDSVIAVVGPTASGKSGFALRLALAMDGEIISADSMQIYRGMDIGTAKISVDDRQGVVHHLLDLRDPGEDFSAADFHVIARQTIREIQERGKWPILGGGTGLYIDSALYNYEYRGEDTAAMRQATARLQAMLLNTAGKEALWVKLKQIDPASALRLHPNDTKRIIRALAYNEIHGRSIAENKAAIDDPKMVFPTVWIGLDLQRTALYQRIDRRVDEMMKAGLPAEVQSLYEKGLRIDSQAGQALGYKQILRHLNGEIILDEAVASIKQETRRYAKRQLTWFRRNRQIHWLDAERALQGDFAERLAMRLQTMESQFMKSRTRWLKATTPQEATGDTRDDLAAYLQQEGILFRE